MGDKAYSSAANRTWLRKRGKAVIPVKEDHKASRRRRGSAGGRPPVFDPERYQERNTVERCFGKLKQFRAVATRYDKRERIFPGTIESPRSRSGYEIPFHDPRDTLYGTRSNRRRGRPNRSSLCRRRHWACVPQCVVRGGTDRRRLEKRGRGIRAGSAGMRRTSPVTAAASDRAAFGPAPPPSCASFPAESPWASWYQAKSQARPVTLVRPRPLSCHPHLTLRATGFPDTAARHAAPATQRPAATGTGRARPAADRRVLAVQAR